tara:strand:- start:176 stop:409 length:234 start_codon:yes stop_codon:yes gene_type:complete
MLSFMRISTASLALVAVLAAPVITTASSPAAVPDLSLDQRQALFQARKAWANENHQRRLVSSRASSAASMLQLPLMP